MPAAEPDLQAALEQPFPGLRAFEAEESFLFFGRERHTQELLARLEDVRLLAIVGTSGSGKSSLVRAGLLPALYRGYLSGTTTRWRVAVMRPGRAPLDELARELTRPVALGGGTESVRAVLQTGSAGIVQAAREAGLAPGESLLVVVDQFEEIFRFADPTSRQASAEALLFVSLLLTAAERYDGRVYIVLTMRTDYLGDCARFPGLAEALNHGQYLVPWLSREERRQAIEGPLRIAGAPIAPRLVQRLLNDAGDDPDQLPVLQHALARTFRVWRTSGGAAGGPIDLDHYERAGTMSQALDQHAQELHAALSAEERRWCEKLFRCLTTLDRGRAVRRPGRHDRIEAVTGAASAEERALLAAAVARFARREDSLLLTSTPGRLEGETVVDISHESLIRKWQQLGAWLKAETESAGWYLDLARGLARYEAGQAGLWDDPEVSRAWEARQKDGWNPAWAEQYLPERERPFSAIETFLKASREAVETEKALEVQRQRRELEAAQSLARSERKKKRAFFWLSILLVLLGAAVVAAVVFQLSLTQARADNALLQSGIDKLQLQQAKLQSTLQKKSDELESASGVERQRLQKEIEDLRNQYSTSAQELRELRQSQAEQKPPKDESASLQQRVHELEDRLKKADAEVVRMRKLGVDPQVPPAVDVTQQAAGGKETEKELQARLKVMEAQVRNAESRLRAATPQIFVLPQFSQVTLREPPYSGRVSIALGDLKRLLSSSATLYVAVSDQAPPTYRDDVKASGRTIADYRRVVPYCPGSAEGAWTKPLRLWCFEVSKESTLRATQSVGVFRLDDVEYQVTATGWSQNAIAGKSDVLSLVVHPVVSSPAKAR